MKNPTRKRHFFLHKLLPGIVFLVLLGASSCKTCNCPAYSYRNEIYPGQKQPAALELKTNKDLPDEKITLPFSLSFDPSQS